MIAANVSRTADPEIEIVGHDSRMLARMTPSEAQELLDRLDSIAARALALDLHDIKALADSLRESIKLTETTCEIASCVAHRVEEHYCAEHSDSLSAPIGTVS